MPAFIEFVGYQCLDIQQRIQICEAQPIYNLGLPLKVRITTVLVSALGPLEQEPGSALRRVLGFTQCAGDVAPRLNRIVSEAEGFDLRRFGLQENISYEKGLGVQNENAQLTGRGVQCRLSIDTNSIIAQLAQSQQERLICEDESGASSWPHASLLLQKLHSRSSDVLSSTAPRNSFHRKRSAIAIGRFGFAAGQGFS